MKSLLIASCGFLILLGALWFPFYAFHIIASFPAKSWYTVPSILSTIVGNLFICIVSRALFEYASEV